MAAELSMTWAAFLEEYGARNSTEFEEEYPTLAAEVELYEERGSDSGQLILDYAKKALEQEKIPVDKVLSDYVDSLLEHSHYAFEGNGEETAVIKYLVGLGAHFPEEKIIGRTIKDGEEMYSYDDEFQNYNVKGKLIDCVACIVDLPLLHAIDWKSVVAIYWEYLDEYEEWLDGGMKGEEPELTEPERLSVLKNYSRYLRKKFPCAEDDGSRVDCVDDYDYEDEEDDEDKDESEEEDEEEDEEDEDEDEEEDDE